MDSIMTVTDGCSWWPKRFNVVPFGGPGNGLPSAFVDDLASAMTARARMFKAGACDVRVYDVVDGLFW